MFINVYAQSRSGRGNASTTATADDRAYTALAAGQAAAAGIRNPMQYVAQNVANNNVASRARVMGQVNRRR